jgi:hypothetical protein
MIVGTVAGLKRMAGGVRLADNEVLDRSAGTDKTC